MLLAHKVQLYPTGEQVEYFARACGSRRHCYNKLVAMFSKKHGNKKYSKKTARECYKEIREEFPWYRDVSQRATRNVVDDFDSAMKHFFRRCKDPKVKKKGFPQFKKKNHNDSFALREDRKFEVEGRHLWIEKLKTPIKLSQELRWEGHLKQVTISRKADQWFASILVETEGYTKKCGDGIVGADLGIKNFLVTSNPEDQPFQANQALKKHLRRLGKLQKHMARKQQEGSNRRAKTKLKIAKLHQRIVCKRQAVLHEITDFLTKTYETIVIEDLNVSGMLKNRKLSRAIQDCGFATFRSYLQYKAALRGNTVIVADRWFASSKTCSRCKHVKDKLDLSERVFHCEHCDLKIDRDFNAALNLKHYGVDTFKPTTQKRTQESCQTFILNESKDADGVNKSHQW